MPFTCLVNNSNLGTETTAETVLASKAYMEELGEISGLPIYLHTAKIDIAAALQDKLQPLLPLKLQEKYFDLPD